MALIDNTNHAFIVPCSPGLQFESKRLQEFSRGCFFTLLDNDITEILLNTMASRFDRFYTKLSSSHVKTQLHYPTTNLLESQESCSTFGSQRLISISRSISDIWNFVVGLQVNNLRSAHVSTNLRIPNARADARYWYDFIILIPFEISSQIYNPVELWKQRGRGCCMDLRKLRSGYLVVHGR